MSLENLILNNREDKIKIFLSWKILLDLINSEEINYAQIQNFFYINKEKIKNSLNILDISKINFIFSLISFNVRSHHPINLKKDHIYSSKFLLFEFLCNYLLDHSEREIFLKENFIPIMQQAFLSKSNNYNEENYQNVIIDVITKYLYKKNIIIPFRIILPMIHKSSNKKNFLGLFDATDPQKKIIPPEIIQEKIADYFISLYIYEIITYPKNQEKILERIKSEQQNLKSHYIKEYNQKFNDYSRKLDNYYCSWIKFSPNEKLLKIYNTEFSSNKLHFWDNSSRNYEKNHEFLDAYHLYCDNRQKESAKSIKNIVNIARKRVVALKQKEISLSDGNEIDSAIETMEISNQTSPTRIINDISNNR